MYYSIENITGKEVGNVFPQVSCLTQAEAHQLCSDEFPKSNPNLVFELEKKAKLTDVLSQAAISAQGLLISEKLKNILSQCKVMNHKSFPVEIKTKKESVVYYWLHFSDTFIDYIDYNNSIFYWTEFEFQQDTISIKSYEDYLKKKQEHDINWGIDIEDIILKNDFPKNTDIFSFRPFNYTLYISENLKNILSKNEVTGLEINAVSNIKLLTA